MIDTLLVFAVVAATASPAPSASPAATPLKEIGRVKATSICSNVVVHANSAISSALRNDATLVRTVANLRTLDFDANELSRRNSVTTLDALATDMRTEATSGDNEVKRLREIAEKTSDPSQKQEIKQFADALGGALFRQKRMAMDLQRMLVIMEGREARESVKAIYRESGQQQNLAAMDAIDAHFNNPYDTKHFNLMAQGAAKDFEERMLPLNLDESKAAEHSAGAVSGCE